MKGKNDCGRRSRDSKAEPSPSSSSVLSACSGKHKDEFAFADGRLPIRFFTEYGTIFRWNFVSRVFY